MDCPFCAEEIKEEAIVCYHCQREIGPFRPLLKRLAALEAKFGEEGEGAFTPMNARLNALDEKLDALREHLEVAFTPEPGGPPGAITVVGMHPVAAFFSFVVLPIGLLLLAYAATVLVYDFPTWVLRVLSILIPIPIGFWRAKTLRRALWSDVLVALAVGVAAVASMSLVLAWYENASPLPQDGREWREVIDYALSITLSYLTGTFIGRWLLHRHQARSGSGKLALDIARIMSGNKQPSKTVLNRAQAAVQRVSAGMSYVVPIVTAAGALVTGLRKLIE